MKKLLFILSVFFSVLAFIMVSLSANAEETQAKTIQKIRIQSMSTTATFYFQNDTGWGAPGCPAAIYVYFNETDPGAKSMLALATTAKVASQIVSFQGECDSDNLYFRANYMTFQ